MVASAIIVASILLLYSLIAAHISRGIHKRYPTRSDLPTVSIVIPARNEERDLSNLLDSLLSVDYPYELLQIIVVDDFSEDRTREIAESFSSRFQCQFEVLDAIDEPDGKLVLKTRPLAQGIDRASGEIILMTDADCIVPPSWVRSMASYYADGVGMVCGTTLPHPEKNSKYPLTWFETLDWLFLLGSCTGMAGRGYPPALIGNNYSVARIAYDDIGTFRGLPFADIDDIVLLKAIEESHRWKVVFPADQSIVVHTRPLENLKELARQRRRWMKGGTHVGWRGRFVITFGVVAHVTLPIWPLILGWWSLVPLGLLILGDATVLESMIHRFRWKRLAWLIPFYPFFGCIYGIILAAMLIRGKKVEWKSRTF